ncbi:hypothetical protein X769_33340 [Mesorhizobium sp. LSJC268A00]|nr:hypothetical protein X773_31125 [Mesorhizobium sp. LSJC285A00]ESW94290.1 hypothetical protein X769_33340 [Mesorhizobium sp. LSJC268A00]ESX13277.1 hypothetical protein X767_30160 [Mesorhizobium sp. LSJC264A00]
MERAMADNKSNRGKQDRARVSTSEPYEVNYFARKHAITKDMALKIIKETKGNRDKANAAAEKLR